MGQGTLHGESGFASGLEFGSLRTGRDSSRRGQSSRGRMCGGEGLSNGLDPPRGSLADTSPSWGLGPPKGLVDPGGRNSWREITLNHLRENYLLRFF